MIDGWQSEKISIEEVLKLVRVTYIAEVAVREKPIILSDGYKAELTIPANALKANAKKIAINPFDVDETLLFLNPTYISFSGFPPSQESSFT